MAIIRKKRIRFWLIPVGQVIVWRDFLEGKTEPNHEQFFQCHFRDQAEAEAEEKRMKEMVRAAGILDGVSVDGRTVVAYPVVSCANRTIMLVEFMP